MEQNQTIKHLSNFNEMLYQRLQDVEHRVERLKIICSSLGASDFSEITQQISTIESEISTMKQTLTTNNSAISSLQETVNSNSNYIKVLQNDTVYFTEQNASLSSSISDLSDTVQELQTTSASNTEQINNLTTSSNNYATQIANLDTKITAIEELGVDTDAIAETQETLSTLKSTVNSLQLTTADHTSKIQIIQNDIRDLPTIRSRSLSNELEVNNLITSFENYQSDTAKELDQRFDAVNEEITSIKNTNDTQSVKITDLQIANNTNIVNISSNSAKITELTNLINKTKCDNELSFILNGTYILQTDIDSILDGSYTI